MIDRTAPNVHLPASAWRRTRPSARRTSPSPSTGPPTLGRRSPAASPAASIWVGTTVPAVGSGTPFSGLTPSIPTSSLPVGTITIGARVRDAAGNWSAATHSATVQVIPGRDLLERLRDRATNAVGLVEQSTNSTTPAELSPRSRRWSGPGWLQAQGNNTNYVQYNFGTTANPAWPTYDARFYFDPNNNASTGHDILAAATNGGFGTQVFHVRYRRNGAQPQVQIQVGNTANASWTNVTNNAANVIEVTWQAGGSLQLRVNGTLAQTLTATLKLDRRGPPRLRDEWWQQHTRVLRRLCLETDTQSAVRAVAMTIEDTRSGRRNAAVPTTPPRHGHPEPGHDPVADEYRSWVTILTGVILLPLMVISALTLPAVVSSKADLAASARVVDAAALEAATGIRVTLVAVTADGGLIDLRFKIVDEVKASHLMHDPLTMPSLYVEGSGRVLSASHPLAHKVVVIDGATYFLLYANAGGAIQSGTPVPSSSTATDGSDRRAELIRSDTAPLARVASTRRSLVAGMPERRFGRVVRCSPRCARRDARRGLGRRGSDCPPAIGDADGIDRSRARGSARRPPHRQTRSR